MSEGEQDERWGDVHAAQYSFMNMVSALAKSNWVADFADRPLPKRVGYQGDEWQEFKADLDHFLVQHLNTRMRRNRRESISLGDDFKEQIRTHLHHIKVQIDRSGLPESRRSALHVRLAEFEKALEKGHMSLALAGVAIIR